MKCLKNKRIGEVNYNNQNELMTIIEYYDANNIIVQFNETNKTKKCAYREFQNGSVTDNFYPSVFNVGYIGDTSIVEEKRKIKDSYKRWADMILRCYSEKHRERHPTYIDCFICDEWLCYANFEKWYNENYYEVDEEKMQLDKDILIKGNKVYSQETCIFVPQRINAMFTKRNKERGKYPIGVSYSKKRCKFSAQVQGYKWLGYYDTPEDAFKIYKEKKEELIKKVADEYKDKIPVKLYDALYAYKVEITD